MAHLIYVKIKSTFLGVSNIVNRGILYIFLFPVTLFTAFIPNADAAPIIEWQKTLQEFHVGLDATTIETKDGGYIIAGSLNDESYTLEQPYLVKMDANGNAQWSKILDASDFTTYRGSIRAIRQTTDGEYIVNVHSNDELRMFKLNSTGSLIWETLVYSAGYGKDLHFLTSSLEIAEEDEYVAIARGSDTTNTVTKLSKNGEIVWQKKFDANHLSSIHQTNGGGYITAGGTGRKTSLSNGSSSLWIAKLDSNGDVIWDKTIEVPEGKEIAGASAFDIKQTSDGGFIIAGEINTGIIGDYFDGNFGHSFSWLIKLDNNRATIWEKFIHDPNDGYRNGGIIQQTSDGGYIFANSAGSDNCAIIKFDATGKVEWEEKSFGNSTYQRLYSIYQTKDDGYIITGNINSENPFGDTCITKFSAVASGNIPDDNADYPIIFVPGIMGSELFDEYGSMVWPPFDVIIDPLRPINPDLSLSHALDLRPNETQQTALFRNYGSIAHAKNIIDGLCDAFPLDSFPMSPVIFFSYDWRRSNKQNAEYLEAFVNALIARNPEITKVNIVAHSMGGIIASAYFQKDSNKINKIITIATPFEGSPEVLHRAASPEGVLGNWLVDPVLTWLNDLPPNVKSSFNSLAELAPTESYMARQPMMKANLLLPSSAYAYESLSYEDYLSYYSDIFGDNASSATIFQNSLDNSGFKTYEQAFFFTGSGEYTFDAVAFDSSSNKTMRVEGYDPRGDGTVPYLSATMMESLPKSRWRNFQGEHLGVLKNQSLIKAVINVLKTGKPEVESWTYTPKGYTQMCFACPVDVTISKGEETLTSEQTKFQSWASFGRLDILGENNDIKMLCVDDDVFPVTIEGTGTGIMNYSISFFDKDGKVIEERVFSNVEITPTTIITTDTGRSGPTTLKVDKDGDGVVDYTLSSGATNPVNPDDPSGPSSVSVSGVTINKPILDLKVSDSSSILLAIITPSNATNKNVTWSTSDANIATVDANGNVTAIAPGSATITVRTVDGGKTSSCVVTVTLGSPSTKIVMNLDLDLGLENGILKLNAGKRIDLRINIVPAGTTLTATGLPEGLTLASDGRLYGSVPSEGVYTVTITATALDGTQATETFVVEVTGNQVSVTSNDGGGCNAGFAGMLILASLSCAVIPSKSREQ